jgi:hypothetical protein
MGRGELKVSQWVGLPTRSSLEAQNGPLYFGGVAVVEPPVSYLESTVPAAVSEMAVVFGSAGCPRFPCRVLPLRIRSPSRATLSAPLPSWQERRLLRTS